MAKVVRPQQRWPCCPSERYQRIEPTKHRQHIRMPTHVKRSRRLGHPRSAARTLRGQMPGHSRCKATPFVVVSQG